MPSTTSNRIVNRNIALFTNKNHVLLCGYEVNCNKGKIKAMNSGCKTSGYLWNRFISAI